MTMPDLNQFHVRRSTNSVNHIYMFHAINSIHLQYNQGAFDFYDTIFCVGPHHIEEMRITEKLYDLPPKQLIHVGYKFFSDTDTSQFFFYAHCICSIDSSCIYHFFWRHFKLYTT